MVCCNIVKTYCDLLWLVSQVGLKPDLFESSSLTLESRRPVITANAEGVVTIIPQPSQLADVAMHLVTG